MWLLCSCLASAAAGHGMMVSPQPRTGTSVAGNNKGKNAGPCGKGSALQQQGAPVATYKAGEAVEVSWKTTIAHGGTCRISLATQGAGVPAAVDALGRLDDRSQDVQKLTDDFPCGKDVGTESRLVTIPDAVACEACVLQWFWTGDGPYYVCSDVSVTPRPSKRGYVPLILCGVVAAAFILALLWYFGLLPRRGKQEYKKVADDGPGHHGLVEYRTEGPWTKGYAAVGRGKVQVFRDEAGYKQGTSPALALDAGHISDVAISGMEPQVVTLKPLERAGKPPCELRLSDRKEAIVWAAAVGRLKDGKPV